MRALGVAIGVSYLIIMWLGMLAPERPWIGWAAGLSTFVVIVFPWRRILR